MDHEVRSIQDFINPDILSQYDCTDLNIASDNIWQTKLQRTKFDVDEYFVNPTAYAGKKEGIIEKIQSEMRDVLFLRWKIWISLKKPDGSYWFCENLFH